MDKYDINILYHILELKHKKIVKDNNLKNKNHPLYIKIVIWLTNNTSLEITKRYMKYQIWNNVNEQDLRYEIDILNKMVLEELENRIVDKILITLKIKKRVEQSHNFYCELCESWIYSNDYECLRSVHMTREHLPIEL